MSKDIIFFSNYCEHCKNILQKINDIKCGDKLTFVSVDDENINIPSFIQVVPTIYLIKEKKIIVDKELNEYLDSNDPSKQNMLDNLKPYFDSNSSFSSMYSSLDDSDIKSFTSSFTYLDEPVSNINTPTHDSSGSKISNDVSKSYEQLQQSRNSF